MFRSFSVLLCALACAACGSSPALPPPVAASQLGASGPVELPLVLASEKP